MDKYIKVFCKQNPKMTLECGNPECRRKITFKSLEVFKNNEFIYKCECCNKETTYDSTKFINDFKKQMKALGITIG